MITEEKIKRGGSKLEITREILESGLDIPVPVSAWRYYGNDLAPLLNDFQKMEKPVIVRGSHQNDYHGFIDVVPTITDVNSVNELERAVRTIESRMRMEDIKIHCEDWELPFTPEVHILMQEQSLSPINGAMLRHPHKTAEHHVQYRNLSDNSVHRFPCSWAKQYLEDGNLRFAAGGPDKRSEKEVKEALNMFQKLEASGILENDWAYQIEFGFNPLLFFQARPFKKFQLAKDFKIPYPDGLMMSANPVFGITPSEGLELDFLLCDKNDLQCRAENVNKKRLMYDHAVGLIQTEKFFPWESPSISLKLGELVCFRSPCVGYDFLSHGNYRYMKKAHISFVNAGINLGYPACKFYDFEDFKKARVFSNGNSGIILPIR